MRCELLFLISLAFAASSTPVVGAPQEYSANIAGQTMSCRSWSGQPVKIVRNLSLQNLGQAYSTPDGKPVMELNVAAFSAFSPKVQQWWFSHECAHHQLPPQLNSEKRADCMAIKQVTRRTGGLSDAEAHAFREELRHLPSSSAGHLAGPERAKLVLKCAGTARIRAA